MKPADVETDPFFELLTDALRAGPGSPQWRDAVGALRQNGAKEADEYRLLISTREDLENGRGYRSVRAGAGFTSKLMDRLGDSDAGAGSGGFPVANAVAILCGIAILVALAYMIYRVASPPTEADQQAIEQLDAEANHFLTDIAGASFAGVLPEGWKQIGSLPLDFKDALRPTSDTAGQGGGIYYGTPMAADAPFMIEANVTVPTTSDAVWLQAFISADADFSSDRATAAREVVWSLQGGAQNVVIDGNVKPILHKPSSGTFRVRIIANRDLAIVEVGDPQQGGKLQYRRVWSGAHHLGSGDRYIGVRFLRTRPSKEAPPSVESVHIAKP